MNALIMTTESTRENKETGQRFSSSVFATRLEWKHWNMLLLFVFAVITVAGVSVNLYIAITIWKSKYQKTIFDLGKDNDLHNFIQKKSQLPDCFSCFRNRIAILCICNTITFKICIGLSLFFSSFPNLPCLWPLLASKKLNVPGHYQHVQGCHQMEGISQPRTKNIHRNTNHLQHFARVEAVCLCNSSQPVLG